jgi:hypothetical protein
MRFILNFSFITCGLIVCSVSWLYAQSYMQRVNTGGSSYTTGVDTFDADQAYSSGGWGYVGGSTYTGSHAIANTTDDVLYQTERWGLSAYRFTVSDGNFEVVFHFAET